MTDSRTGLVPSPVRFEAMNYGLFYWHAYWSDTELLWYGTRMRMFAGTARTRRKALRLAEAAYWAERGNA